jgi:virginiamycin B lyase
MRTSTFRSVAITSSTQSGSNLEIFPIGHGSVCGRPHRVKTTFTPTSIVSGPDGALWYGGICLGRMTTRGLVTNAYRITTGVMSGPGGALLFGIAGGIAQMPFPLPREGRRGLLPSGLAVYQAPTGISVGSTIVGPDGALWFIIGNAPDIGRLSTSGAFTEYPIPTGPYATTIAAGSDGAIWFTTFAFPTSNGPGQTTVSRMTTSGVVTASYPTPFPSGALGNMVTGPDGALWFPSNTGNCVVVTGGCILYSYRDIVKMTTAGVFTDYPIPEGVGSGPDEITVGPDGALWFTSNGLEDGIGRITTSGVITNCTSPALHFPEAITTGPDGAIWFTNYRGHSIGRIPDPSAFTC